MPALAFVDQGELAGRMRAGQCGQHGGRIGEAEGLCHRHHEIAALLAISGVCQAMHGKRVARETAARDRATAVTTQRVYRRELRPVHAEGVAAIDKEITDPPGRTIIISTL
jgi:hypothetical protein